MIPYLKKISMDYIYILVTVAILMYTKIWEEETIDIVDSSMFSTCDIDRT